MRHFTIFLAILFLIVSCSKNQHSDLESEIVMKIMNQKEIADSNLTILNFKQGQIMQNTHNDTIDIFLNGWLFLQLHSRNDSSIFEMFPEEPSYFETQGFWDSEMLNITELTIENIIKLDLPYLPKKYKPDGIYNFDWENIPKEINGFTTFSKLDIDENDGLIAQMIYSRSGMFYMKLYWVNPSEEMEISEIQCKSYRLIGFSVSYDNDKISYIEPAGLVINGPC